MRLLTYEPVSQLTVSFRVKQFYYNGFHVGVDNDVFVPYTANFVRWTEDPGIALFSCSDGKKRLIPSCALYTFSDITIVEALPEQVYADGPLVFGAAASS